MNTSILHILTALYLWQSWQSWQSYTGVPRQASPPLVHRICKQTVGFWRELQTVFSLSVSIWHQLGQFEHCAGIVPWHHHLRIDAHRWLPEDVDPPFCIFNERSRICSCLPFVDLGDLSDYNFSKKETNLMSAWVSSIRLSLGWDRRIGLDFTSP